MKYKATFVKNGEWWIAWTDDVPGAITQGQTLEEAGENLKDAISEMLKPDDLSNLPGREIVLEEIEV
ncbi:MAG: type II toxin-antitoxin system HicB family antitoxin [Planctomycetes bacterium]|nr:type II toxin-antitoxin system HicB family antitoxin [Planctomycetota bacterium]